MALILIRHTRVAVAGLCYGRTDVPLADTFVDELAAVHTSFSARPGVVYTSPALRCRRLAGALGASDVRTDARLQELDFGAWENRLWSEIPRAEIDAWAADFVENAPPRGESFRALAARVDAFRRELSESDAVIVTHGGVIRAWLSLVSGQPLREAFAREVPPGACFSIAAAPAPIRSL